MPRFMPPPHKAFPSTAEHRRKRLATAWRVLREQGPGGVARVMLHRHLMPLAGRLGRPAGLGRMRALARAGLPGRPPVVVLSTVDYAFPYRQRPQHLALAFARLGHPVFYVSARSGHDRFLVSGVPAERLCVTDAGDFLPGLMPEPPIVLMMSTDNRVDMEAVARAKAWSPRLVYDYIDHIDPAISMMAIPAAHMEAHHALLRDEEVLVVASAQVLHDEVARLRRPAGLVLAQNAVDTAHFRVERATAGLAPGMAAAVARGAPIIGYFGALASWFDYDLVAGLARARPGVSVVLIGPDYDGSQREWRKRTRGALPDNLFLVPAIPYDRLPAQAAWFDVAMVPFLVNEITLATSPLKLYEYFAMGAPVVSTPLPECARHQPAVLIAEGVDAFAAAVDRALALRADPAHRALLAREAEANDWRARAEAIAAAVREMDARRRPGAAG
jgi:hypothetical protein